MKQKVSLSFSILFTFAGLINILLGLDWHYDVSPRIEALGSDFAGVIFDRITDIEIRNPVYLKDYRALTFFHKGHHYAWGMPLKFAWFHYYFGLVLGYGGRYFSNTDQQYPKNQFYRFNLSGFYATTNFGLQYDFFLDDQRLDYAGTDTTNSNENFVFHCLSFAIKPIGPDGIDLRCRLGIGYYDSTYSQFLAGQFTQTNRINFFIPSAQIGISWGKRVIENGWLNLLLDFGGPASGFELRRLPISFQQTVKRNTEGIPVRYNFFANSFTTRFAGALSIKPTPAVLIAFGINDFWSGARTNPTDTKPLETIWFNFLSLPIGLEYQLNQNINLRGGIRGEYYYLYSRQQIAKISSYWYRTQNFGLGLRLFPDWYLDIASFTNLFEIESIDLLLRKEWR